MYRNKKYKKITALMLSAMLLGSVRAMLGANSIMILV